MRVDTACLSQDVDYLCSLLLSIMMACLVKTESWSGNVAKLQVETAQGLTIRVINNVSKRMEAKPRFHEAFQKEGCPDAFPYRQKVLNPCFMLISVADPV